MAHEHEGRTVVSEQNTSEDYRMLGMIHDTGDIGIGEIGNSGRYSARLYSTDIVRAHAQRLLQLCDLADGKATLEEAGFADEQAADEEE